MIVKLLCEYYITLFQFPVQSGRGGSPFAPTPASTSESRRASLGSARSRTLRIRIKAKYLAFIRIRTHEEIYFVHADFLPRKKAEGRGFEPLMPLQAYRISSAAHSASLATLRFSTGRVRRLRPLSHSSSLDRIWTDFLYLTIAEKYFLDNKKSASRYEAEDTRNF